MAAIRGGVNRLATSGQIPFESVVFDQSGASEPDRKDWPINEVAPAIEALLADFDERLDEFDVPRAVVAGLRAS